MTLKRARELIGKPDAANYFGDPCTIVEIVYVQRRGLRGLYEVKIRFNDGAEPSHVYPSSRREAKSRNSIHPNSWRQENMKEKPIIFSGAMVFL